MRDRLLIFAIAFAGGLAGANVQPILTGAGKLLFPENATPASISASGGALTYTAGGTDKGHTLVPTGTGAVSVNALSTGTLPALLSGTRLQVAGADGENSRVQVHAFANPSQIILFRADGTNASPSAVQLNEGFGNFNLGGWDGAAYRSGLVQLVGFAAENCTSGSCGAYLDIFTTPTGGVATARAIRVFGSGGVSVGSTTDPGAGIVNASTKFAVNGTGGTGGNTLFTVCTSGACITSCTLQFNGGIRVGGTCP